MLTMDMKCLSAIGITIWIIFEEETMTTHQLKRSSEGLGLLYYTDSEELGSIADCLPVDEALRLE